MNRLSQSESLLDRIGGAPTISAALDVFWNRVFSGQLLADFFSGVGVRRLKTNQFALLSQGASGSCEYTGASMQDAVSVSLSKSHFDAVAVHLLKHRQLAIPENIVSDVAPSAHGRPLHQQA